MSSSTRPNSDTGDDPGREPQRSRRSRKTRRGGIVPRGAAEEIQSTLRTYYQTILGDLDNDLNRPQLIALTSCKRGEGVSTVSLQLAICAAQQGTNVLLVDCNENNPSLHRAFGVKSSKGFRDFLKDGNTLDSIHETTVSNLSIMPYGRGRILPLPKAEFENAIESIQSEFDLLILDLPAIAEGRHTTRWAASLENLLLVIGNSISPSVAAKYKKRLENAGANLCGIVRNLN